MIAMKTNFRCRFEYVAVDSITFHVYYICTSFQNNLAYFSTKNINLVNVKSTIKRIMYGREMWLL